MAANQAPAARTDPIFEVAFRKLKGSVTEADAAVFQSTKFEDVWKAAEDIEKMHREKRSLMNMRRIEPFLKGLEGYSKVIEVLCNGTPYMPWIWAPIKLMLQVSSGYLDIFDKLLNAYRRIAEAMPQFGRLQKAFEGDENFKLVLGMVYSDILDFHGRAYKFFRRRSWHIFFDSLWKSFEFRFANILDRLAHHRDLLMKEAFVIDITDSHRWRAMAGLEIKTHAEETRNLRDQAEQELRAREKQTQALYLHDSIAWLKVADEQHDDELERLAGKRQQGTCEWVFQNSLFKSWKDDVHGDPFLWVKGIPGAGKTILSTYVIRRLQEEGGFTMAYHICNSYTTGKNLLGEILRSIVLQLLRANIELAPFIFDNYANKGLAPAIVRLRRLLPELLSTVNSIRIIIDGLDEYPESDQRVILAEFIALSKPSGVQCKVLFFNRDEGSQIRKVLASKPTIDLKGQFLNVSKDIEAYVKYNLKEFRYSYPDALIDNIEKHLVKKAAGMFLWVRLIMKSLEDCNSEPELIDAINTLPDGLHEAYGRILRRVMEQFSKRASKKAVLILEWVACSFRILKSHEIQDGIFFYTQDISLDERSRFQDGLLGLCKPLIETGPKNTVDFVHYSAKEYILHNASGPFLKYHQAHYNLAFSCMNYLISSECFLNESITLNERALRVLKGFHGLHQYANEFWFRHLLQYAKFGIVVDEDRLEELLDEIRVFWKDEPGKGTKSLTLEDKNSPDHIEVELEVLNTLPQAQSMLLDLLRFRQFLSQEKYAHQKAENLELEEVKRDPTFFSSVDQECQSIVQHLVNCTEDRLPDGALRDDLTKFKEVYMGAAFICRSRECARHFEGFDSSAARDEHEASHTKPLRCADPSCEFFSRGFASKKALDNHNRKHHPPPDEIKLPKFEPRRVPDPPRYIPAPESPRYLPAPEPDIIESPSLKTPDPAKASNQPKRQGAGQGTRAKKGLPVHICEVCGKVFNRAENLRRHTATHGEPQLVCSEQGCQRAFFREDILDRHLVTHSSPEFLCPYEPCGKAFHFPELLGRHVITHGPQNFPCTWENCDRAFHFADVLRRHQNQHQKVLEEQDPTQDTSRLSNSQ